MKEKDYKLVFIDFLKTNNVYDLFLKYLRKERSNDTLTDYLGRVPVACYLDSCFFFINTEEGAQFWRNLNKKWVKIAREDSEIEGEPDERKSEEKGGPKQDTYLVKKFKEFLEGAGVYRRFFLYLSAERSKESVERYFDVEPYKLVSCAFPWGNTDEGNDFWRSLSEDWKTVLEKEQKKQKEQKVYKLVITMESLDQNALIRDRDFIKEWATSDVDIQFSDITEDA